MPWRSHSPHELWRPGCRAHLTARASPPAASFSQDSMYFTMGLLPVKMWGTPDEGPGPDPRSLQYRHLGVTWEVADQGLLKQETLGPTNARGSNIQVKTGGCGSAEVWLSRLHGINALGRQVLGRTPEHPTLWLRNHHSSQAPKPSRPWSSVPRVRKHCPNML